jgi:hypothetical protein
MVNGVKEKPFGELAYFLKGLGFEISTIRLKESLTQSRSTMDSSSTRRVSSRE